MAACAAALIAGCATKSRSFDAKGMYASESGQVAIGKIHVDAIPEGTDSAVIHYSEDTAWISNVKTHDIDIILTGTNSVGSASNIVDAICGAFVSVAPITAATEKAKAAATAKTKEDGAAAAGAKAADAANDGTTQSTGEVAHASE